MTLRYRFISEHRANYGVQRLCRILAVRRPGFYEWLAGQPARRERARVEDQLAREIAAIHGGHRGAYGSRWWPSRCAAGAGGSTANGWSGSCGNGASSGSPDGDAAR